MYKQISSNKRNSYLLLFFVFAIIVALGIAVSFVMGSFIGLIIAIFIGIIYSLIGYSKGKDIVLKVSGAHKADPVKDAYLINTIEGLALAAGVPTPEAYIIEDPNPNAFATGKDPKDSAIAVTRGLIHLMNRAELEGVIAHEMSHIKNYDIKFMTLTAVLVGMIAIIAHFALRMMFFGGIGGRGRGKGGNPILLIIGVIFIVLAPIFATLVQLAISRKREYLADASGALLTRYPPGLANALEKLKNHDTKVKTATSATAPLFIAEPMKKGFTSLLATHPPIEKRIEKLRKM
ncbi:zinc metalloprotease HtpX [Candidatus Woesearchaeota archaeon]|nr:MAG: zinc metalloprotease HtpX [Candidatus Woesearchaeota archaeon]